MTSLRRLLATCAVTAALGASGCSSAPTSTGDDAARSPSTTPASSDGAHTHDHAGGADFPPAGDGTSRYQIGYTLRGVRLPREAGEPGRLGFRIDDFRGRPQTRFLTEQDKEMHVYVVRDDLAVFRHVHPEMRPDGRWVGNLTLPEPGRYRVVAEFMARDEGGHGDFVMLGARASVPGEWEPQPPPEAEGRASDWGVRAHVLGDVTTGDDGELRIRLDGADGAAPRLGTYLGTSAHLTGFHVESGSAVHMHPLGEPVTTEKSAELRFHTSLPKPGRYVLFLQVSVEGFLHTLPVGVTAT